MGFCKCGRRRPIAFGVHGSGPPLVKAANWMTHLEHDWRARSGGTGSTALGERHRSSATTSAAAGCRTATCDDAFTLDRGCDLEAVVDAAGLDRSRCSASRRARRSRSSTRLRHPERVTHLVALRRLRARARAARLDAVAARGGRVLVDDDPRRLGTPNAAFRRMFTTLFLPDGHAGADGVVRRPAAESTSPETAARICAARGQLDVTRARAAGRRARRSSCTPARTPWSRSPRGG